MEEVEEVEETLEEKRQRILAEEQELRTLQLKVARHTVFTGTQYQWEETDRHTASAAVTTRTIQIPYDDAKVFVVTSVAAMDESDDIVSIALYSVKAGERHLLKAGAPDAQEDSVNWTGSFITGPNQSIEAVFKTPSNNDKLVFTAMGYWTNKGKLP